MWLEITLEIKNNKKSIADAWIFDERIEYDENVKEYYIKLKNGVKLIKYVFKDAQFKEFKMYLLKLDKNQPEKTVIDFLKLFFKNKTNNELIKNIIKVTQDKYVLQLFSNIFPEYSI